MAAKSICRGNIKVGKYYKIVNKRLGELFYIEWKGEGMAYIYSGVVKKEECPYKGIVGFPIENDDIIKEVEVETIFLEVI